MNTWYEKAIFYHMYPFGMVGANKHNDNEEVMHHFNELEEWIPHLKEIEITALYIGPLFESTTHGYDTKDYYLIDRRLGTNDEFKHFVDVAHKHDIKVVVDGVFNHTGKEFFAFKDIIENRENSRYCDWYKDIDFNRSSCSGESFSFGAWRNIYELANLNLDNEEVRNYLLDVIKYWIHEFNIDGIRLDCADCLPFHFIKEMRLLCESQKEDFWLMGELIHGDYSRWISNEMLHSSTNYELHKALYSAHNDHNYFEIAHSIKRQFDQGGIYEGMQLYSFVDNHDVDRIASKLNNIDHLTLVHILLFTLPGIPSIYYGSEWGIEGKKEGPNDDPLRPKLDIKEMIKKDMHPELIALIKKLGKLKHTYAELNNGKYKELLLSNKQYAYARILDDEIIIVAMNNAEATSINIPCVFNKTKASSLLDEQVINIENNALNISLKENEAFIFKLS